MVCLPDRINISKLRFYSNFIAKRERFIAFSIYYKEAVTGCLVCLVSEENLPIIDVLLCELADPLPRVLGVQQLAVGGGPEGGAGDALTGDSLRLFSYSAASSRIILYVQKVYLMH